MADDGVRARRCDILYIVAGDIVILELLPELSCCIRTDKMAEEIVDLSWRVHTLESEHVSLRIKPVAEIRAYDK